MSIESLRIGHRRRQIMTTRSWQKKKQQQISALWYMVQARRLSISGHSQTRSRRWSDSISGRILNLLISIRSSVRSSPQMPVFMRTLSTTRLQPAVRQLLIYTRLRPDSSSSIHRATCPSLLHLIKISASMWMPRSKKLILRNTL